MLILGVCVRLVYLQTYCICITKLYFPKQASLGNNVTYKQQSTVCMKKTFVIIVNFGECWQGLRAQYDGWSYHHKLIV